MPNLDISTDQTTQNMPEADTAPPVPPDSDTEAITDENWEANYHAMVLKEMVPMKEPRKATWGASISATDYTKLRAGVWPRDMDHKWWVVCEDPDADGLVSIHFLRSWTSMEIYRLHIDARPMGDDYSDRVVVEAVSWEGATVVAAGGVRMDAEQARREVVWMSRILTGCEFEKLPEYRCEF